MNNNDNGESEQQPPQRLGDNPSIDVKKHRPIKSFVRHRARLSEAQQHALANYRQDFGIEFSDKIIDFSHFGHFEKVILEIGFGNGESLIGMAEKEPTTLFIGAEVHTPGVARALMLAQEKALKNVRVIQHDAVALIDHMLGENSIDRVQVFFPDPWHKKRHFKRRLIQTEFCQKLHRVLKPNGVLHVATDWLPYAKHCVAVMDKMAVFENQSATGNYVEKPDYRPETKFERRGLKLGHEVKEMLFRVIK